MSEITCTTAKAIALFPPFTVDLCRRKALARCTKSRLRCSHPECLGFRLEDLQLAVMLMIMMVMMTEMKMKMMKPSSTRMRRGQPRSIDSSIPALELAANYANRQPCFWMQNH
jgi:hypothetical protein